MLQPTTAPAGGATGGENALSQATTDELGKNDFLKMLTTQLKNQDPSNPMKGREFAAQLAQFTSVEQLTNISSQLESEQSGENTAVTEAMNRNMATNLIGRQVEAGGNQIGWTGDGTATVGFELDRPASEVALTIRDGSGTVVRTKTLEDVSGTGEFTWDGTTDGGSEVPEGTYSFQVSATDGNGEKISTQTHLEGTVDRITLEDGGAELWIGGPKISMDRVQSVSATNS